MYNPKLLKINIKNYNLIVILEYNYIATYDFIIKLQFPLLL